MTGRFPCVRDRSTSASFRPICADLRQQTPQGLSKTDARVRSDAGQAIAVINPAEIKIEINKTSSLKKSATTMHDNDTRLHNGIPERMVIFRASCAAILTAKLRR